MRKSRIVMVVVLVALVMTLGGLGLTGRAPSSNRAVTIPIVSYNTGKASQFHTPLSSIAQAAIDREFSLHGSSPNVAAPPTVAAGMPSVPVNAVRFINDLSYMPQSETTIAVDPTNTNHVVGGVNDGRYFFCSDPFLVPSDCPSGYTLSVSGFTASADGARSILKSDDLPGLNESVRAWNGTGVNEFMASWGDPSVVAGVNGEFFYATLLISTYVVNATTFPQGSNANGIELSVSNAGLFDPSAACRTPVSDPAHNPCWDHAMVFGNLTDKAATFEDKELLAVDRNPASAFYGDVYVSWDHFISPNAQYPFGATQSYLSRCTPALSCTMLAGDSLPALSGPDPYPAFTTPTVGRDGTAYFTWCNYGTAFTLGPLTCSERSYDPAASTWSLIHHVVSFDGPGTDLPGDTALVGFATEQFRTANIPVIAADTSAISNNLYFTVDVCTTGNYYNFVFVAPVENGNCGLSATLFSRSTDGGATWSTPVTLSSPAVNVQPWVTVDPLNGNVVVVYYTTEYDPFNHRTDVVADVSTNQGASFSHHRITNVSNEPDADPVMYNYLASAGFGGSFVVPQYGDYLQADAFGGEIWVSFTGNYASESGTLQADPWVAVAPEGSPLAVTASASPALTDPGVTVTFHATATNSAGTTSYAWTFGDGATGTGASPTHAYAAPGTYSAEVTATDALGRSAASPASVTVTTALTAQLAASPTATDVGRSVSFMASASGGSGSYTYAWAFGDGATASTAVAAHAYGSAGTFTVKVWVNDSGGASVAPLSTLTVNPLPAASASPATTTTDVGVTVALIGRATGGTAPLTYQWSFFDGSSATIQSPTHTYGQAGTFAVVLTVTDAVGATSTSTVFVAVNALPAATAKASTNAPNAGEMLTFTGSVVGGTGPYTYAWTFGEGGTDNTQNPTHAYTAAGTYTVTLKVTDSAGVSSTSTLTVVAGPPGGAVAFTSAIAYSAIAFVIGAVLTGLVIILLRRRRKKEPERMPASEPPEPPGDEL